MQAVGGFGHGLGGGGGASQERPPNVVKKLSIHGIHVYNAGPVALMLLALLACANSDTNITKANPLAVADPSEVDFGEVVRGDSEELIVLIENQGAGNLQISGARLTDDSSSAFGVVGWPAEDIHAGGSGNLSLSYSPDVEGSDLGVLELTTNQDDLPTLSIQLTGQGVGPVLDLDPSILNFGIVEPSNSVTKDFRITAGGTGTLSIDSIELTGDSEPYTLSLPASWTDVDPPYELENGASQTVHVTFAPSDTMEYQAQVELVSNDPDSPLGIVELEGNVDAGEENTPPTVEIEDPNNGDSYMDNDTVELQGYAYDPDEAVTNLLCGWYADSEKVSNATIATDGTITGEAELPIGSIDLTLRCIDSDAATGEDTASVVVWDHTAPVEYVISGGSSIYDYWTIDDDVTIFLNGAPIFTDANKTSDTQSPIQFEAVKGDTIEIVATDVNSTIKELSPLVLHWGTSDSQSLNDEVCEDSDPGGACYTGSYEGPWPNIFFDETYTINIP